MSERTCDNTVTKTEELNCEVPVSNLCQSGMDHGVVCAISDGNSGSVTNSLLLDRLAQLDLEPAVGKDPENVEDALLPSLSGSQSPVRNAVLGLSISDSSVNSSVSDECSDPSNIPQFSTSLPVLVSEEPSNSSNALPYSPSARLLKHMDITEVCDGLYLSDYISLSASKLHELSVTLVINATKELPNVEGADSSVEFLKLFVDDVRTQDIAQYFDLCADKIRDLQAEGGVSLVHCALGISRSVTICLAYLVKHGGRTLRQAYLELKKKRQIIRPNDGFWRQLIAFETTVLGRPSVKLLVYPMGVIPDVCKSAHVCNSAVGRRQAQRYCDKLGHFLDIINKGQDRVPCSPRTKNRYHIFCGKVCR